jgi:hypothetical protein
VTVLANADGSGPSLTALKQDINAMMSELGGGYQLTEVDLSGFRALDE